MIINYEFMKYRFFLLIPILFLSNCKHEAVRAYYYKTGELQSKCIYPDKKDTMNFQQLDYYPTGELLSKTTIQNGKIEGEYIKYYKTANILERGMFLNNNLNGIFQQFDSIGRPATETYYLSGTRILYSDFLVSKDEKLEKQRFHGVTADTAFPIGALVKMNDTIQKDLSFYAVITGKDSINTLDYCFKLQIFAHQNPDPKYEITFGKPNIHLVFSEVDTNFISTKDDIYICNLKLVHGLNHIFGRVIVNNKDSASFFVYKDVFVNAQ